MTRRLGSRLSPVAISFLRSLLFKVFPLRLCASARDFFFCFPRRHSLTPATDRAGFYLFALIIIISLADLLR